MNEPLVEIVYSCGITEGGDEVDNMWPLELLSYSSV
jgi:hypothetical protein